MFRDPKLSPFITTNITEALLHPTGPLEPVAVSFQPAGRCHASHCVILSVYNKRTTYLKQPSIEIKHIPKQCMCASDREID